MYFILQRETCAFVLREKHELHMFENLRSRKRLTVIGEF
jgi:hypothetical protein